MSDNHNQALSKVPAELLQEIISATLEGTSYRYEPPGFHQNYPTLPELEIIEAYMRTSQDLDVDKARTLFSGFNVSGPFKNILALLLISRKFQEATRYVMRNMPLIFDLLYSTHVDDGSILKRHREAYPRSDEHTPQILWPTQELERCIEYIFRAMRDLNTYNKAELRKEFFERFGRIEFHFDAESVLEISGWLFEYGRSELLDRESEATDYSPLQFENEMLAIGDLASENCARERKDACEDKCVCGGICKPKMVLTDFPSLYQPGPSACVVPTTIPHRDGSPSSQQSFDEKLTHTHILSHALVLIERALCKEKAIEQNLHKKLEVYVEVNDGQRHQILPNAEMTKLVEAVENGDTSGQTKWLVGDSMRHYAMSKWLSTMVSEVGQKLEVPSVEYGRCDACSEVVALEQ